MPILISQVSIGFTGKFSGRRISGVLNGSQREANQEERRRKGCDFGTSIVSRADFGSSFCATSSDQLAEEPKRGKRDREA